MIAFTVPAVAGRPVIVVGGVSFVPASLSPIVSVAEQPRKPAQAVSL
jgi:hypothetical protein